MVLLILRALFVLIMAAAGWLYLNSQTAIGTETWLALPITLTIGVICVCIDILAPRQKLAIFSGAILGLIVGITVAYGLSLIVQFLIDQLRESLPHEIASEMQFRTLAFFIKVLIGFVCCYLAISFVVQTKDDFKFIIPYVEFAKQAKGPRPILLDTSVLIDGRIADIAATGILEEKIIVPQFILEELQAVADSPDKLKRNRGRRGLDVLAKLRSDQRLEVILYESPRFDEPDSGEVDQKLIKLAKELHGRVVTTDHNLNKVAKVTGVDVININDLSQALKPVILPGERMTVRISRPGEEPGQGIGYLEDGTMVVVEHARQKQGQDVEFTVIRAHQTSAGRMIFGRVATDAA